MCPIDSSEIEPEVLSQSFAAHTVLKHLNSLSSEIDGVLSADDIEHVHRMRVASRRLRVSLIIFNDIIPSEERRKWRTQIQRITQSLGAARDTDIQCAAIQDILDNQDDEFLKPGINRLLLRLRQSRAKLQTVVVKRMDKFIHANILEAIKIHLTPLAREIPLEDHRNPFLWKIAENQIQDRLNEFLSWEEFIADPNSKLEHHAMRIAAKKLRYTVEIFTPIAHELRNPLGILKESQETLGQIHDSDVWLQFLPEFMNRERNLTREFFGSEEYFQELIPGIDHLTSYFTEKRISDHQDFYESWQDWQRNNVWEKLKNSLHENLSSKILKKGKDTIPDS